EGYDPFYAPDPALLGRRYQAITCTEVVEHLHDPAGTFRLLDRMLAPGGWLGVMTCFQTDDDRFANWHYRRDPTHVVFYREATLRWVAGHFGWECEVPRKDVALMRKPR
ncbi:MAG: class I SAM-dependent methyltransferase, partial [Gammaproteobacteria bacterium]|nr:class I SAM-dependent methyltransferase [Gammaproteobacteria bacterium]